MRVELPLFKRCCFCMPLRWGLLVWAYFNVIINTLALFYFSYILFLPHVHYTTIAILGAVLLTETAFNIILLVACHKKNVRLMKVSYIYCLVILVLTMLAAALLIFVEVNQWLRIAYFSLSTRIYMVLMSSAPVIINIFVQVYVTLLVRSEMVKLRDQSLEMQFVNHAAAGEARCVRACPDANDDADA